MIDDPYNSIDHASYTDYLQFVNEVGIPDSNVLSYNEFIANVKDNPENVDKIKLGFVIPANIRPKDIVDGYNTAMDLIDAGISTVEGVGKATQKARSQLRRGIDAVKQTTGSQKVIDVIDPPRGNGPTNLDSDGDGSRFTPFDARRLNYNAKPIEIRLNTGIVPAVYAPYYLEPLVNRSPLHITSTLIRIPESAVGKLYVFFDQVLSLAFQNASQANLSFNLDVVNNLSTTKIKDYFNNIMYALQVYYFYTSVINYADYAHNHNAGMIALRKALSADDLDDLYQLHRILDGIPIPPNLNNLIFYISQNFSESSLPGSPILKISPIPFTATTSAFFTTLTSGKITAAIDGLTAIRSTTAIISRIVPAWLQSSLLSPSEIPVHDLQFNTIFSNLPGVGFDTSQRRTPFASNLITEVDYNSYVNDLDGAVYALMAIYNSASSLWLPSLTNPETVLSTYSTTKLTNRVSYYTDNTNVAFHPVDTNYALAIMRPETNLIAPIGTTSVTGALQRHDSEQVLGVNGNTTRETAYKLIEWMMSLDSLMAGAGYDRRNPIKFGSRQGPSSDKPKGKSRSKSRRNDKRGSKGSKGESMKGKDDEYEER